MGLRDRVARLERRPGSGLTVIMVEGGLPGPEYLEASAGGRSWPQWPGELKDAFVRRATALAKEAGAKLLVVGGLPSQYVPPCPH